MKRLIIFSYVIFITLIINSCGKDKTPKVITPVNVTAKWRWIYTYIDVPLSATNPLTPANTGTTEGMEYTSDKQWKKYYNNAVIDSGTYSLEHNTYTNPSNVVFSYDQITYDRNNTYLGEDYYRMQADTLIFDPGVRDFWTSLNVHYIGGTKWFVRQ